MSPKKDIKGINNEELENLITETIENLEKIKEHRLEERGSLSELFEDEIVVTIKNMIDVLRFEYIIRRD